MLLLTPKVYQLSQRCNPETSPLSLGLPFTPTPCRIEDDAGAPVISPETEGELLLAGELLARYTDAALTAAKFVWREGTRWYKTGDIVRKASQPATAGFEYICRRDLQV